MDHRPKPYWLRLYIFAKHIASPYANAGIRIISWSARFPKQRRIKR